MTQQSIQTCLRLKKPFLSQLGIYRETAKTWEVSFMLWIRLSSLLLQGPCTKTQAIWAQGWKFVKRVFSDFGISVCSHKAVRCESAMRGVMDDKLDLVSFQCAVPANVLSFKLIHEFEPNRDKRQKRKSMQLCNLNITYKFRLLFFQTRQWEVSVTVRSRPE